MAHTALAGNTGDRIRSDCQVKIGPKTGGHKNLFEK